MRNKIIEEIYNDKQYIEYCFKVCKGKDLHKDLFQYVVLYLMEMPQEKLERLHRDGELKMYIARIIYCSINGNRSQFLKQLHGGPSEEIPPTEPRQTVFNYHYDEDGADRYISKKARFFISSGTILALGGVDVAYKWDVILHKVYDVLDKETAYWEKKNLYPAPVRLFEIYLELGTFMAVSEKTKIPYKTVRRHIQELIEKIKSNL